VDNSARLLRSRAKARHHRPMDVAWTVGVLPAGVENVQVLAAGVGGENRASAVDMASGALIVAAADRGRAEYRVSLAGTELMVIPGLDRRGRSGPVHPPRDGVGH